VLPFPVDCSNGAAATTVPVAPPIPRAVEVDVQRTGHPMVTPSAVFQPPSVFVPRSFTELYPSFAGLSFDELLHKARVYTESNVTSSADTAARTAMASDPSVSIDTSLVEEHTTVVQQLGLRSLLQSVSTRVRAYTFQPGQAYPTSPCVMPPGLIPPLLDPGPFSELFEGLATGGEVLRSPPSWVPNHGVGVHIAL
jgi:hypothetical protein